MSLPIADFHGDAIYLDTMIPYALIRGIDEEASTLFQRIERGEIQAYTSVLTFDELSYRLLLALIRDTYKTSPLDHLRENEAGMIQQFYPAVSAQLAKLRTYSALWVVEISLDDLDRMDEAMRRYYIRPRDALHLAAMQKVTCLNLVSNDSDWDRVPTVQ